MKGFLFLAALVGSCLGLAALEVNPEANPFGTDLPGTSSYARIKDHLEVAGNRLDEAVRQGNETGMCNRAKDMAKAGKKLAKEADVLEKSPETAAGATADVAQAASAVDARISALRKYMAQEGYSRCLNDSIDALGSASERLKSVANPFYGLFADLREAMLAPDGVKANYAIERQLEKVQERSKDLDRYSVSQQQNIRDAWMALQPSLDALQEGQDKNRIAARRAAIDNQLRGGSS